MASGHDGQNDAGPNTAPEKKSQGRFKSDTFTVDSIEQTESPENGGSETWYRYVLKSKRTSITGMRAGSLAQVTEHAERVAEQLNERGSFPSTGWTSRHNKI